MKKASHNPNIYGFSTKNISCPEFIKLANNLEHFLPDSMLNIPIKHVNQIRITSFQIKIMENNKRDNELVLRPGNFFLSRSLPIIQIGDIQKESS